MPSAKRSIKAPAPAAASVWGPRQHLYAMGALWLFALLAYSNSFSNPLIFDSNMAIAQDSRVWSATAANVHALFTQDYWYPDRTNDLYRPLTKLSYLFDYAVLGSGANPFSYHAINFLLHAVNLALVYLLGWRLFKDWRLAWAMAAIWGLHPVLTESVANIVGRADLLAGFGVLAGLLCHLKATESEGRRRAMWLAALALVAAAGIFSKESAVVLPAVMLAYDVVAKSPARWRDRAAGYAAIAVPFAGFFYLRARMIASLPETESGTFVFLQNPLAGASFWTSRLTAIKVIGHYLVLWLWPARLSCDYSYNQIPLVGGQLSDPGTWAAIAAVLGCMAALVAAFVCHRSKPWISFLITFFFLALAPTSNLVLVIGTIMGERFLYLPSIAFAALAAAAIFHFGPRRNANPHAAWMVVGAICLLAAGRTFARNADWRDDASLWASAREAAPGSYMAHIATGGMERALAILEPLPDNRLLPSALGSIGAWMRGQGDRGEAGWYRRALVVLERARRVDQAQAEVVTGRNRRRGFSLAYYSSAPLIYLELGRVHLRLSQPREALAAFDEAWLRTQLPEVAEARASAYQALGEPAHAIVALHEGLLLSPEHSAFLTQLAALYQKTEDGGCAVVRAGRRMALDATCAPVRVNSCLAIGNLGLLENRTRQPELADRVRNAAAEWGCPAFQPSGPK